VGAGDREVGNEVALGDPGLHVGGLPGAKREGSVHHRRAGGRCCGRARDDSKIDATWSIPPQLIDRVLQGCELVVAERLPDNDQDVDVAAARREVIERERAVQDDRDERISERVRRSSREPGVEGERAEAGDAGHERRFRSSASNGSKSGQPI
jgi:hypothetical protein